MGQLAIIAEYNPFHNGHEYLIQQAKLRCDVNSVLAIMSGNFLQRGEAALWNKFVRASMACKAGVDIVLELPLPYATGSARDFATGAIAFINNLNTVTHLAFGVETDHLQYFEQICEILTSEPDYYKKKLQESLAAGLSYPAAREVALGSFMDSNALSILKTPNNILAIEYMIALKKSNSSIKPILIKRTGSDYHDTNLDAKYSSASAIRNCLNKNQLDTLTTQVPNAIMPLLELPSIPAMNNEAFISYIQGLMLHPYNLKNICDFSQTLQDKFIKCTPYCTYNDILMQMKSKDVTYTRIARALLHSILLYTNEDRDLFFENGYIYYANVLALRKESSKYLKKIQTQSNIPVITKKADFDKIISCLDSNKQKAANRMWELDQKATNFFNILYYNHYKIILPNDYQTPLPIISGE